MHAVGPAPVHDVHAASHAAQTRSATAEGGVTSYWDEVQTVCGVHVPVGGFAPALSWKPEAQAVHPEAPAPTQPWHSAAQAPQTRSLTVVGALDWYCPAAQSVRGRQVPESIHSVTRHGEQSDDEGPTQGPPLQVLEHAAHSRSAMAEGEVASYCVLEHTACAVHVPLGGTEPPLSK